MNDMVEWVNAFQASWLKPVVEAAEAVKRHLLGIAGFVSDPNTNAATEGVNGIDSELQAQRPGGYRIAPR
jgi:hypothetical protein